MNFDSENDKMLLFACNGVVDSHSSVVRVTNFIPVGYGQHYMLVE
jgi:hypothetical protein